MSQARDILIHMISEDDITKASFRYWVIRIFILGYYDELTLELANDIHRDMLPHMKMLYDICNDVRGFRHFVTHLQSCWDLHVQHAVADNDMMYIRLYFEGTPNKRPSPNRLLQISSKFGHMDIADYLICEHGADPKHDNDMPYRIARLCNQHDMMMYFGK